MDIKQAKSIAFGSKEAASLDEYYAAWQYLYDKSVDLEIPDVEYMDKLICDGFITIEK